MRIIERTIGFESHEDGGFYIFDSDIITDGFVELGVDAPKGGKLVGLQIYSDVEILGDAKLYLYDAREDDEVPSFDVVDGMIDLHDGMYPMQIEDGEIHRVGFDEDSNVKNIRAGRRLVLIPEDAGEFLDSPTNAEQKLIISLKVAVNR